MKKFLVVFYMLFLLFIVAACDDDIVEDSPAMDMENYENISNEMEAEEKILDDYIEGRVLIKYEEPMFAFLSSEEDFSSAFVSSYDEINMPKGSDSDEGILSRLSLRNDPVWLRANLEEGIDIETAMAELENIKGVHAVEPDYIRSLNTTDSDDGLGYHHEAINVDEARLFLENEGINPGGKRDIIVAVIDTGVDYTHPDLAPNMWVNPEEEENGLDSSGSGYIDDIHGVSTVGGTFDNHGDPMDHHGHGTHVAGIIAGVHNEEVGARGVADNVRIMAIKAAGSSGYFNTSDIVEGINYAVEHGADVINMSFGGSAMSLIEKEALELAFNQAVLVSSAGNSGLPNEPACSPHAMATYPAAHNFVIGVMSSNQQNQLSHFSNLNCSPRNSTEYEVVAPGSNILSTFPGDEYVRLSGTSMAAPVVSGLAALLRSHFDDPSSHSSRFIMGQIIGTADKEISISERQADFTMHSHFNQINAGEAFNSVPVPNLNVFEHYIFDDETIAEDNIPNGVIDAGETIDLGLKLRNHWGKADNVSIKIDTLTPSGQDDPYIDMVTDEINVGSVGTFNTKDNDFIYEDDEIIGVDTPLRFKVADDTPNDYYVNLNITIKAENGLDPNDNTVYEFKQSILLTVRSGRELPNIIDEDMTLTNDVLWIIPSATLIEEDVTVDVEEGTHLQFWSNDPESVYADQAIAYLRVLGQFNVNGTEDNPVKMYPSGLKSAYPVSVFHESLGGYDLGDGRQRSNDNVNIKYAEITNPRIGANLISHTRFQQNYNFIQNRFLIDGTIRENNRYPITIRANSIQKSSFKNLGTYPDGNTWANNRGRIEVTTLNENLFDSNYVSIDSDYTENNTFLNNHQLRGNQWDDRDYYTSLIGSMGRRTDAAPSIQDVNIVHDEANHEVYIGLDVVPLNANRQEEMAWMQSLAESLNGNLAEIRSSQDQNFIRDNITRNFVLPMEHVDGEYQWLNGNEISYENWDSEVLEKINVDDYVHENHYLPYSNWSWAIAESSSWIYTYIIRIEEPIFIDDIVIHEDIVTLSEISDPYQLRFSIDPNDVDEEILFDSLDESIVTVDKHGVITPVSIGETSIRLSSKENNVEKTITVQVTEHVALESFELSFASDNLPIDSSQYIDVSLTPQEATEREFLWSSSNETKATVDEFGKVTAHEGGFVNITATHKETGLNQTIEIEIYEPLESLSFSEGIFVTNTSEIDQTLPLVLETDTASNQAVIYESSNPEIAYVDDDGKLVNVSAGNVVISATSEQYNLRDEIIVSVNEESFDSLTPIDAVMTHESNDSNMDYLVLMNNGSVWVWGAEREVPFKLDVENVIDISSGRYSTTLVTDDSTVYSYSGWGRKIQSINDYSVNTDLSNVVSADASREHTLALTADGNVWGWGYNRDGALGSNEGSHVSTRLLYSEGDATDVIALYRGTLILTEQGKIHYMGRHTNGNIYSPKKIDNIDNAVSINSNEEYRFTYETINGEHFIYAVYYDYKQNLSIDESFNETVLKALDMEYGFALFLTEAGNVISKGSNDYGRLGIGVEDTSYNSTTVIEELDNIVHLEGGRYNGIAIDDKGEIFVWGANTHGQLATLNTDTMFSPSRVHFGIYETEAPLTPETVYPKNNAEEVSVDETIIIGYNQPFRVSGSLEDIQLRDEEGRLVAINIEQRLNEIIINPLSDLQSLHTYELTIGNNVLMDLFRNAAPSYTLNFTTEEVTETTTTSLNQVSSTEPKDITDIHPSDLTEAIVLDHVEEFIKDNQINPIRNNAILNNILNPNLDAWMRINAASGDHFKDFSNNYWGTTNENLVNYHKIDFDLYQSLGKIELEPFLKEAPETAYPFVTDAILQNEKGETMDNVSVGDQLFTVTFNRDMDQNEPLNVYFGPDYPYTDYRVSGDWIDARTWQGNFTITPLTGDGDHYFRIRDGRAADDKWLRIGDDTERFKFEVATAGTESMNLQASGAEGRIELSWMQDEFETLQGYNIYRSSSIDGEFVQINETLIPHDQRSYSDDSVEEGQLYYYKFTVVQTDMDDSGFKESDYSNIASAAAYDTIPPTIEHTPLRNANLGTDLNIRAYAYDNVSVEEVLLHYRAAGEETYETVPMISGSDNLYTRRINIDQTFKDGFEYYIEVSDGLMTTTSGSKSSPHVVNVQDVPVINSISPAQGSADGGERVTITGSNFKDETTVYFGTIQALDIDVVDENTIKVTTPNYHPSSVNVRVVNPTGDETIKEGAYQYTSEEVLVEIPDIKGRLGQEIYVPVFVKDVEGLLSADMTIQYDNTYFEYIDYTRGAIATRFITAINDETPGTLNIAMASDSHVSGSGEIIYLKFKVLDTPEEPVNFTIDSMELNSGNITVETRNGTFEEDLVYQVNGTVHYYSNGAIVKNVEIVVEGETAYITTTDENGKYHIQEIAPGDYTLSFSKDGGYDAISAYDASLVLRYSVGLITLDEYQQLAADVNNDGVINSFDASMILRYVAGIDSLPFEGRSSAWIFTNQNIAIDDIIDDHTFNTTAILIGDVSGAYSETESQTESTFLDDAIKVGAINIDSATDTIVVPLHMMSRQTDLYALETTLYFSEGLNVSAIHFHETLDNYMHTVNTNEQGQITIALAGIEPMANIMDFVTIEFSVNNWDEMPYYFTLEETKFNETNAINHIYNVAYMAHDYDLNNSGDVTTDDFNVLLDMLNKSYNDQDIHLYDFNHDGIIDIFDLIKLYNETTN